METFSRNRVIPSKFILTFSMQLCACGRVSVICDARGRARTRDNQLSLAVTCAASDAPAILRQGRWHDIADSAMYL